MKHIYTSIDIGSDTIKLVVCELYKNKLNLLAASSVKSKGIKKGLITDVEEASISIRQAFNEIEDMLGIHIKQVIASIPSYFAEFTMVKGETRLLGETVVGEDVINVLENAIQSKLNPNKEMVTILPIDFSIDNQGGIKEPKGLNGTLLGARAIMVTTPKKNVYSVISLLEEIGVEVVDISLNSIGDAYAFKNKENSDLVGAIVNIGAETTSVSLYNKGIIVKNSVIGLGGKSIDNDLAYMYKIDMKDAVRMKEKFALAYKKYASPNEGYEVLNTSGEKVVIKQLEASEIVMSRIEEILTLARKEISILAEKPIEYIIVTGGVSSSSSFDYIVSEILGKNAIVGNVKVVGIRNNKYSSVVGNIVYFIHKQKLKGQDFTMISNNDMEALSSSKRNVINISNDTMLGKVFGYFFGE
ncbi:MAG: cell division protein FtsA [Bacilli bacterium]|nr:cell division protein FtsA [Bacilli bacterium]